jgi:hypothetical protein
VSDQDFRDLLAALNFEANYDQTKRELANFQTGYGPPGSVPPEMLEPI